MISGDCTNTNHRLWREDVVAAGQSVNQDELYGYDGVYRLTSFDRGDLNANKDGLVSQTKNFAEQWALDPTGNWTDFDQDTNGDETWELDQQREHNEANEVEVIEESSSHVAHDAAGNMTKVPQPDDWSDDYTLTYDAWNRLVKVQDGETTVAEYQYDGQNRRTMKTVSGTARHFYYSSGWQVLEERVGASTYADCQYVWGARYVDDLVLRDRDSDGNPGTGSLGKAGSGLDERLYALQDPNYNVVALAESDGDIVTRYRYTAYGQPTPLNPNFTTYTGTNYAWPYLYTGRREDPETGLMYYRNRYYHTSLGRFVSHDPIGFRGGMNFYQYVGDSPVSLTDPLGEKWYSWIPIVGPITECFASHKGDSISDYDSAIASAPSDCECRDPDSEAIAIARCNKKIGQLAAAYIKDVLGSYGGHIVADLGGVVVGGAIAVTASTGVGVVVVGIFAADAAIGAGCAAEAANDVKAAAMSMNGHICNCGP